MNNGWHVCPAPSCLSLVPPELAFCYPCWEYVPDATKESLAILILQRPEKERHFERVMRVAKKQIKERREREASEDGSYSTD